MPIAKFHDIEGDDMAGLNLREIQLLFLLDKALLRR